MSLKKLSFSSKRFLVISAVVASVFFAYNVVNQKSVQATDNKIVTISVDGKEFTVSTRQDSVESVLQKAQVTINEHDLVEPALDTQIREGVFNVNVYRARPVVVVDGMKQKTVMTPSESPKYIAKKAGIEFHEEDKFEFKRVDNIIDAGTVGQELDIIRATPVTINLYGNLIEYRTHATTVDEVLAEKGIVLADGDTLTPKPQKSVEEDMIISVVQVGTKIVTKEEVIPAEVKTINDSNMPVGEEKVKEEGADGLKLVTYEYTKHNGKIVKKRVLQTVIKKEAKQRVVIIGAYVDTSDAAGGVWAQLRACEAGGDYTRNSGNGYYGAYQFSPGTWAGIAAPPYNNKLPHEAPPGVQDKAAADLQRRSGWGQWPGCSAKLGLPY